jgi:Fungal cellulose binding domain
VPVQVAAFDGGDVGQQRDQCGALRRGSFLAAVATCCWCQLRSAPLVKRRRDFKPVTLCIENIRLANQRQRCSCTAHHRSVRLCSLLDGCAVTFDVPLAGGKIFHGPVQCTTDLKCMKQNKFYSQCLRTSKPPTVIQQYMQCGGKDYHGLTGCARGLTCQVKDP